MIPPLVSFVTWNRLGLTARNLKALLDSDEDFELCITDNNSQDATWEYLKSVTDCRIKSKTRFDRNMGPVYASNFALSKRKKEQFFFTIDNDVHILTKNWLSKFMQAFEVFPDLGLLGAVRQDYYDRFRLLFSERNHEDLRCLFISKGFVEGCCQCLRPEVLDSLGYWCEENCMGDIELCYRILKFTPYRIAYFPTVEISQEQCIACGKCIAGDVCPLYGLLEDESTLAEKSAPVDETCFQKYTKCYANPEFRNKFYKKYEKFVKELEKGSRPPYCASIHDAESMAKVPSNLQQIHECFKFYAERDANCNLKT